MQIENQYQKRKKIYEVYSEHFSAIRFRAREGREYILHAFTDVLKGAGLTVEQVQLPDGQRIDPASGEGLLLLERECYVDIAYVKHLNAKVVFESWERIPRGGESIALLIFNFGSGSPEYYSPDVNDELSDDEDE
jgi:hypothetical protein